MTMTWNEQPDAWDRTLTECETVIERGLQTFVEVGQALLEIRDRKLYSSGWSTFEDYCQERWGWSDEYRWKMVRSAETLTLLDNCPVQPRNEAQVRPLTPLLRTSPTAIPVVWEDAQARAAEEQRPLTATDVQQAVERHKIKSHAEAHAERLESYRQSAAFPEISLPDPPPTAPPLFVLQKNRVVHSDALSYLCALPDACAHLCITSPPYWAKREYTGDPLELGREHDPNEYVQKVVTIVNEIGRVLVPWGYLFLNLGDTYASQPGQYRGNPDRAHGISPLAVQSNASALAGRNLDVPEKSLVGIPWRVLLALTMKHGWRCANVITWVKEGAQPENVYDRLTQRWEPILVLTKAQHAYLDREALHDVGTGDVWQFPVGRRGAGAGHYAPFPDELVRRAITAACPESGVVLDPFAGSGTTLTVTQAMGRQFLGCDLLPPKED